MIRLRGLRESACAVGAVPWGRGRRAGAAAGGRPAGRPACAHARRWQAARSLTAVAGPGGGSFRLWRTEAAGAGLGLAVKGGKPAASVPGCLSGACEGGPGVAAALPAARPATGFGPVVSGGAGGDGSQEAASRSFHPHGGGGGGEAGGAERGRLCPFPRCARLCAFSRCPCVTARGKRQRPADGKAVRVGKMSSLDWGNVFYKTEKSQ